MISDYIIQILHETHKCKWTFFVQIIFYKNRIFAKKIFLLNHTSWVYFLDYMSLPYHFGKLWMSTFNCFQWFFTKAKRIHVIPTNTRELFFGPDLSIRNKIVQIMNLPFSCSSYLLNSCMYIVFLSELISKIALCWNFNLHHQISNSKTYCESNNFVSNQRQMFKLICALIKTIHLLLPVGHSWPIN